MVQQHDLVIIANPVSCRGKGRRGTIKLTNLLRERGIGFVLHWTEARGDAEAITRRSIGDGNRKIVVCGGDGTVQEVVNGIKGVGNKEDVILGLVPLGQCNDLANALSIPHGIPEVVATLLHGESRVIDLGRVGERYFSTIVTLGFDSVVNEFVAGGGVPSFIKGTASYMWGIFAKIFAYSGVWLSIKGDFGQFEGKAFLVATGNTHTYGGRIKIVPPAVIDDGYLDICLVHDVSRLEILRMLPRAFTGGHVNHRAVELKKVRRMEIDAHEPISLWADGEFVASTPTVVEIVPHALRVLVPARQ